MPLGTHAYDADHRNCRNCSWESKFSTFNDGESAVVLPMGFEGSVPNGMHFRCLRLPLGYEPPTEVLDEWKDKKSQLINNEHAKRIPAHIPRTMREARTMGSQWEPLGSH